MRDSVPSTRYSSVCNVLLTESCRSSLLITWTAHGSHPKTRQGGYGSEDQVQDQLAKQVHGGQQAKQGQEHQGSGGGLYSHLPD